jgi:hypothetical protein
MVAVDEVRRADPHEGHCVAVFSSTKPNSAQTRSVRQRDVVFDGMSFSTGCARAQRREPGLHLRAVHRTAECDRDLQDTRSARARTSARCRTSCSRVDPEGRSQPVPVRGARRPRIPAGSGQSRVSVLNHRLDGNPCARNELALRAELKQLVERHGPTGTSKVTSPNTLNSRSKVSCGILPTAPPVALEACPRVAAALVDKLRGQQEFPRRSSRKAP